MLTDIRDSGRKLLSKFSGILGEGEGVEPESLSSKKRIEESIAMDWEEIEQLLPYESITEDNIFVNKNSIGFGLYLAPSPGADDRLVQAHADLLKQRLPAGFDLQGVLYKHHYLANDLYRGFEAILKKGGIYEAIGRMSIRYHLNAVRHGYKNKNNIPAQLADFSSYFFISTKKKRGKTQELFDLRVALESELSVAGYSTSRMGKNDLKTLIRVLTSPDLTQTQWPTCEDTPNESLSKSMVKPNTTLLVNDDSLDITVSSDNEIPVQTRIVNLMIAKWPKKFALWSTPDLFANIFSPDKGIQCPFLISFTVRGVDQEKVKIEAKQKAESLGKNNNGVQRFLNPNLMNELEEWEYAYSESSKSNLALMPTFYNVMLFTTEELERKHVAQTLSAYREFGFELSQKKMSSWNRYLASLPFFCTEGIFDGLEQTNNTKRLTHYTCANLLPFIADFKGSPKGMLLPTIRGQLAYVDTFDDKNLPITNYNFIIVGSSGSGKSKLNQHRLLTGLAQGEQIFVIDLGDSYKHLCELVGGTYINASTIALNPFTLFDFDGEVQIEDKIISNATQIRDLLAIMASPHAQLSSIQNDYLLDATERCWKKNGSKSCIDKVLTELRLMMKNPESKGDTRLSDLIIHLKKYGNEGIYGHMFNSETPFISNSNFVVLEMGEFEKNPELLTIIMYVMIVVIQGQFYNSDKSIRKLCVIDEAYRFLAKNSNPLAAKFIEQGFRTARKYNAAFGVIFQGNDDVDATIQGRAVAASSDTKFIMRQGNFDKYIQANPNAFDERQQRLIKSFSPASSLGFSNVMVKYEDAYTFHRYFSDPFTRILFSSNAEEFEAVEKYVSQGMGIEESVYKVAEQYYGDQLCND